MEIILARIASDRLPVSCPRQPRQFDLHKLGNRGDPASVEGASACADRASAVGARPLLSQPPRSAIATASAGFDLQLSGRPHGGQMFPWSYVVGLAHPLTPDFAARLPLGICQPRRRLLGPAKRLGAPWTIADRGRGNSLSEADVRRRVQIRSATQLMLRCAKPPGCTDGSIEEDLRTSAFGKVGQRQYDWH